MKQTFYMFRISIITLTVIIGFSIWGCESDPILSPQVEVAEESGGSYGNTNLPVNGSQNTQDIFNEQENRKIEYKRSEVFNPKRF